MTKYPEDWIRIVEALLFVFSLSFPVTGFDVTLAPIGSPLPFKLGVEDLCTALPGEPGLLEGELAHVHVVPAGHQQDGSPAGVELHLAGDPETVEVSVPPASDTGVVVGGIDEGNLEQAMFEFTSCLFL